MSDPLTNSIEQLYIETFDTLYTYAQSHMKEASLAQEAVQETFCIACEKPTAVLSSPNPTGWLMRTLRNVIRNMKRSQIRASYLVTALTHRKSAADYIVSDEQDIDLLYGDMVESADYQLLKKLAVDHYSMLELAEELGINLEACKKRVQRAKKALRKKFEKYLK